MNFSFILWEESYFKFAQYDVWFPSSINQLPSQEFEIYILIRMDHCPLSLCSINYQVISRKGCSQRLFTPTLLKLLPNGHASWPGQRPQFSTRYICENETVPYSLFYPKAKRQPPSLVAQQEQQSGRPDMVSPAVSLEVKVLVTQACPTLQDTMDYSPLGPVHGILQARILEWVAITFSRASSWPKDQIRVFQVADRHFTIWATSRAPGVYYASNWPVSWQREVGPDNPGSRDSTPRSR